MWGPVAQVQSGVGRWDAVWLQGSSGGVHQQTWEGVVQVSLAGHIMRGANGGWSSGFHEEGLDAGLRQGLWWEERCRHMVGVCEALELMCSREGQQSWEGAARSYSLVKSFSGCRDAVVPHLVH